MARGAHRASRWWCPVAPMFLVVTNAFLAVTFTSNVVSLPLKVKPEELDIVGIVTSIEDQDVQDVLGRHDINATDTEDSDPDIGTADVNSSNSNTTQAPSPVKRPIIISGDSPDVKDEQSLIFEFPNRCPEGQKQDSSGKCREPFAPEDDV